MSATILSCVVLLFAITAVHSRYAHPSSLHRGITLVKVVATWEEAKQRCERDDAILASPLDSDLLKYMTAHIGINNHSSTYFIGMKAEHGSELRFVSIEGTKLEDLPEEVQDMIDQIDPRDGDCLSMDQNTIRAVSCWERLPFLCYKNESSQHSNEDCGEGYILQSTGSCYKPHKEKVTWNAANGVCEAEGGHLVIINDADELQLVMQIRPDNSKWTWVGLQKGADRQWRTVLGDPLDSVYNIWASDRFNNYKCGFLRPNGLDDLQCDLNDAPFLCEKSNNFAHVGIYHHSGIFT